MDGSKKHCPGSFNPPLLRLFPRLLSSPHTHVIIPCYAVLSPVLLLKGLFFFSQPTYSFNDYFKNDETFFFFSILDSILNSRRIQIVFWILLLAPL